MSQISYSDGILLRCLCENVKKQVSGKKDMFFLSKKLSGYISRIENKANGYWRLPTGKKIFLDALKALSLMCRYGITKYEVDALYHDYNAVLSNINKQCNVTFFVQEYSTWNSLKSIYELIADDLRFIAKVVYVPFYNQYLNQLNISESDIKQYKDEGISIILYDDYDLSEENPDLVFFAKPYDFVPPKCYIKEVEKIVDKTVYIPYGMEVNYKLLYYGFQNYLHYRVWRHIVYGQYVKEVGKQFGYRNGENIVAWGHPKMDYFIGVNGKHIPTEWKEKIAGRKVICWCPHHTILSGKEHLSTWLDYQETIFNWIERNNDIVLLWRPHPLLFGALVNNKYMSQEEMDSFLQEKKIAGNVILDTSGDYHSAFNCSDAMITDGTTFSVEYLGTGKPLMLTTDDITTYYNYKEAQKGLYIGDSKEVVIEFLENVRSGRDPKKEAREQYAKKIIFYPQGQTVSEFIVDNLLKDLIEAQESLARSLCE